MRNLAVLACLAATLVGCIEPDPDGVPPPGGGQQAGPCDGTTVLQGVDPPMSIEIQSRPYDTAGQLFCYEVDSRLNYRLAHLAISTTYAQGASSGFELTLLDANDVTMRDGWDVQFGNNTVFANLEYGFEAGNYVAVKLLVRATTTPAVTGVGLSVFEPFE
jgi:hypothetical protein